MSKLEEAAMALADAADDVGAKHFDTDTTDSTVEAMQRAAPAETRLTPCSV